MKKSDIKVLIKIKKSPIFRVGLFFIRFGKRIISRYNINVEMIGYHFKKGKLK